MGGVEIFTKDELINEYGNHVMDRFEFENCEVLENVNVEFIAKGTPEYDENGNITNMIIFCHGYDGTSSSINDFYELTGEGRPLDFNKYFIISIASLGFPESCCPSTTGLKNRFPKYDFKDKVNFKKQFIKEKYDAEKVLGVLGVGMGGFEVFTWACEYPDDMEFIIIGNSSYKTNGYRYITAKGIKSLIEDNEHYHSGQYDESISRTMITTYKILYSHYFSQKIFQSLSNDEIDVLMDDYIERSLFVDIYDFKYQCDSILDYDLEDKLSNIKARTLIIGPKDDLYFSKKYDIIPLEKLVMDCEIRLVDFNRDQLDIIDYSGLVEPVGEFLNHNH